MKRMFFVVAALAVILGSCATKGQYASQKEIDDAFESVYGRYRSWLIMDGAENYTVAKGDSLTKITGTKYGSDSIYYFPVVMLASDEVSIADPDLIEPGMKLKIPDLKKNLDNAVARGRIKSYLGEIADIYEKKGTPATAGKLRDLAGTL